MPGRHTASAASRTPDQGADVDQAHEFEVVVDRHPTAFDFIVRAHGNGRLYRILPTRDPQQRRFWCVVFFRCSPAGIPDEDGQVWIGPRGLERDALKETLGVIRADPSSWLAASGHQALRNWMLDPAESPAPVKSINPASDKVTTP
jgi:hypothetical protein